MTPAQRDLAIRQLQAIAETIIEAASLPDGIPSGHCYAALMPLGITLEAYETIIETLIQMKKIRRSNHCLFAI